MNFPKFDEPKKVMTPAGGGILGDNPKLEEAALVLELDMRNARSSRKIGSTLDRALLIVEKNLAPHERSQVQIDLAQEMINKLLEMLAIQIIEEEISGIPRSRIAAIESTLLDSGFKASELREYVQRIIPMLGDKELIAVARPQKTLFA